MFANDANSEYAPGYAVANARAGFMQRGAKWKLTEFVRVDNLTARNYVGAIVVGDANARFYEAAPKRSAMLGVSASIGF